MSTRKGSITHEELFEELKESEEFRRAWAIEIPKAYIAANMLRVRESRGLTQKDLAQRTGMRQPRIAELERGDTNPTLETLARVAYGLGISVADLVADPERPRNGRGNPALTRTRKVEITLPASQPIEPSFGDWKTEVARTGGSTEAAVNNLALSA